MKCTEILREKQRLVDIAKEDEDSRILNQQSLQIQTTVGMETRWDYFLGNPPPSMPSFLYVWC